MPRITLVCLLGVCAALHAGGGAHAQAYPTKVIKMSAPGKAGAIQPVEVRPK